MIFHQGEPHEEAIYGRADRPHPARGGDDGLTNREVCNCHNIAEQTLFRWRSSLGAIDIANARRLKDIEPENAHLKKTRYEPEMTNGPRLPGATGIASSSVQAMGAGLSGTVTPHAHPQIDFFLQPAD